MRVAIVGAGLIGRMLACELAWKGKDVRLFDRDDKSGLQSCAHAAAGMLAPYSELETAETLISLLGIESLLLWPKFLAKLSSPVFFQQAGTLIVAHRTDSNELVRLKTLIEAKLTKLTKLTKDSLLFKQKKVLQELSREDLQQVEPELPPTFSQGLYLPEEGQISNRQLLESLSKTIQALDIPWQTGVETKNVGPCGVKFAGNALEFDLVVDCRGLGAKGDLKELRGVRGEIIRVYAPEVKLLRPVRLVHPRYPLYIVPRPNQHFVIGATSLESEDFSPITVQSALELLSAAFSVHSGFACAVILEMLVNCRPALTDNLPKIYVKPGLIRINGLYRHGFLIAPQIVSLVSEYIEKGSFDMRFEEILVKEDSAVAAYN